MAPPTKVKKGKADVAKKAKGKADAGKGKVRSAAVTLQHAPPCFTIVSCFFLERSIIHVVAC